MGFFENTLFPPSSEDKFALLARLWNLCDDFRSHEAEYDGAAYLAYYGQQCSHAGHDEEHILVSTHHDICELATQILQGASREDIICRLSLKYPDLGGEMDLDRTVRLNNSVDLAARLVSMVNVGVPCCTAGRGGEPLIWAQGPLNEFLRAHFNQPSQDKTHVKLDFSFKGRNLERLGRIRVDWTSKLEDHLLLTDDSERRVAIFHHASFLKCQQSSACSTLPSEIVEETLRTIALLFPQSEKRTVKWFRKKCTRYPHLDSHLIKCGGLRPNDRQIEKFRFWRDRLIILKEAFDEKTKPSTFSQLWYDRRNRLQWSTFWVAILVLILTVFFGIVQSIEGALQVYKTYHPTAG
ncbi:uncharacterized protein A1O5_11595 [Cladophialophora psammophila CBS 110553]|uniref:Uncharacterized protein n=1 Tax=Cladophialophora psammophila CBS 110553 TaxID=1182543 RepID=W9WYE7_9EURO|nr:uncharacterized protein A1O5_11595 [Cladophialophora psammophila CBS 110553]EXJ63274.1 hypothetical protein A1O5_11595 [Cladophialophora psammophila CBS 110553]